MVFLQFAGSEDVLQYFISLFIGKRVLFRLLDLAHRDYLLKYCYVIVNMLSIYTRRYIFICRARS